MRSKTTLSCIVICIALYSCTKDTAHFITTQTKNSTTSQHASFYPETVKDIDGNEYHTIIVNGKTWMAENLRVSHYRNGSAIFNPTDPSIWNMYSNYGHVGAWCNYDNDKDPVYKNDFPYGKLYNWYAVDHYLGLAPKGWHIATKDEWKELIDALGGPKVAGGKLKDTTSLVYDRDMYWEYPNSFATDSIGFGAVPNGYCDTDGKFYLRRYTGFYWTSTEASTTNAYNHALHYINEEIYTYSGSYPNKSMGLSVRCVKD